MSTLAPPVTKKFAADSIEKKVYDIAESLSEFIPIANDRNRLGYCLYKYMTGQGDAPEILVKSTKIKITGISSEELAKKLDSELTKIKQ